jgi:hypothetical protein
VTREEVLKKELCVELGSRTPALRKKHGNRSTTTASQPLDSTSWMEHNCVLTYFANTHVLHVFGSRRPDRTALTATNTTQNSRKWPFDRRRLEGDGFHVRRDRVPDRNGPIPQHTYKLTVGALESGTPAGSTRILKHSLWPVSRRTRVSLPRRVILFGKLCGHHGHSPCDL